METPHNTPPETFALKLCTTRTSLFVMTAALIYISVLIVL